MASGTEVFPRLVTLMAFCAVGVGRCHDVVIVRVGFHLRSSRRDFFVPSMAAEAEGSVCCFFRRIGPMAGATLHSILLMVVCKDSFLICCPGCAAQRQQAEYDVSARIA